MLRKPAPPTIGNAFARAVGMQAAGRRTSNATELASTVPGFQSREWPPWLLPALIALFGLALRLYRLDHESYWGDEVFAFALVKSSWAGMHAAMVKDVVLAHRGNIDVGARPGGGTSITLRVPRPTE